MIPAGTVGSKNGVDRRMDRNKSRTDLLAAGRKRVSDFAIRVSFLALTSVSLCVEGVKEV